MSHNWVQGQLRTMTRWVSAKAGVPVNDLVRDVGDGLVLVSVINRLVADSGEPYVLTPLYARPKFALQKAENVNDVLDFLRLVLKINVVGISAESVVGGDAKSILGLVWSLFVYSSSACVGARNAGSSLAQVKSLLLSWLNSTSTLVQVANFDRDWSVEVNDPGLVLESVLRHYLPTRAIKHYDKKLQNLANVLELATHLGIPKLVDIDDFVHLVPDEKCILSYLSEWYTFFELNSPPAGDYDELVCLMEETITLKYEYETKALRYLNKINATLLKLENWTESARSLTVTNAKQFTELSSTVSGLNSIDMPELAQIYSHLIANMLQINSTIHYDPSKSLHPANLLAKTQKTVQVQQQHYRSLMAVDTANSNAIEFCGVAVEQPVVDNDRLKAKYLQFKDKLLQLDEEFSYGSKEIKQLFEELIEDVDSQTLRSFISFIPTKVVHLTASDSDFSLVIDDETDEEVDHSKLIFENNRKRLGSQLMGANDRVYDLHEFFMRFEDRLRV